MNAAIDFSRFVYKQTKPRLSLYEDPGKENRADAARGSPVPNNAHLSPERARRMSPRACGRGRHTVVPETPDEERVSAGEGRRRMRPAAAKEKRKRRRLSSSSSSERGNESRDLERVGGGARGRTGSPLSKKRKNGESLFQSNNTNYSGDEDGVKEGEGDLVPRGLLDPKINCESSNESDIESGSSSEYEEVRPTDTQLPPPPPPPPLAAEDGWLSSRTRPPRVNHQRDRQRVNQRDRQHVKQRDKQRVSQRDRQHYLSRCGAVSTGPVERRRDLESLKELFPGQSESVLRERLNECSGVDEAIASILASDDPPQSPRRPAHPRSRRLRLLSHSSSSSSSEDDDDGLPNITCTTSKAREDERKRGRRGRKRVLEDSPDESGSDVHHTRTALICLTSDSEGEGEEGEREKERDGERSKFSCGGSYKKCGGIGDSKGLERTKEESPVDLDILVRHLSDHALSSDEGDYSKRQKVAILSLLGAVSEEEAQVIPGLSVSKAGLLLSHRPFLNWRHLTDVISSIKGLSEQCLEGCVQLLREREMVGRLLSECLSISSSIASLVDHLRDIEDKESENSEGDGAAGGAANHFDFPLPSAIPPGLVLKPYQKVGVSWLSLLHSQNLNAILADEMGLGKTVQAIVFLSHLCEAEGWRRPHLIVVPSSTIDNWARELQVWNPSLNVLIYWGTMSERADMRQEVLYGNQQDHYDIFLTTYTVCIGRVEDRNFFRKLHLKTLVLDEGHMLKNMATLKYNHLMKIQAERRLLLTGTPLQNNLLELMSLLSFVMPSVFRPYLQSLRSAFQHSRHVGQHYLEQVARAKEIMRPFILRRLKKEVLAQLPGKTERVERCPLTRGQLELYQREVEGARREMGNGAGKEIVRSMSVITKLRKAANHPLLLRNHYTDDIIASMSTKILKEREHRDADAAVVAEDMSVMSDFELHNLCLRHQSLEEYSLSEGLIRESGKLRYLEKKLSHCQEQGDRVLVFSQFTMVLDILEAWLQVLGHAYLRLDGSTPMNDRQGLIDQYNSTEEILVFLLSTKAGGLGINLTSANVVVVHDIDFNPYNDKQAEDRCHRLGQTREVEVVRLVGRDTIEEEILNCAEQKLKLEQDMTTGSQLSKADMVSLLSQGLKL